MVTPLSFVWHISIWKFTAFSELNSHLGFYDTKTLDVMKCELIPLQFSFEPRIEVKTRKFMTYVKTWTDIIFPTHRYRENTLPISFNISRAPAGSRKFVDKRILV